jgi:hypothetical protein
MKKLLHGVFDADVCRIAVVESTSRRGSRELECRDSVSPEESVIDLESYHGKSYLLYRHDTLKPLPYGRIPG